MKKKVWIALSACIVLVVAAYWLYDYYAGNHIEITEVINATPSASGISPLDATETDKTWKINGEQSKVYFSVTTSKESVSFEAKQVEGSWDFRSNSPQEMKASAKMNMNEINSGNSGRDNDVKGPAFFNVSSFPDATFTLTSIEGWPTQWVEGQKAVFQMNGKLTVKNISKDVRFDAEALFEERQLKLQGKTIVTFSDFGMNNPHMLVLKTEDEVTVILRIVLDPA